MLLSIVMSQWISLVMSLPNVMSQWMSLVMSLPNVMSKWSIASNVRTHCDVIMSHGT